MRHYLGHHNSTHIALLYIRRFALRSLTNQQLGLLPNKGLTLVAADEDQNTFACALAKVMADLMAFGFQSTLPKLKQLVPLLFRILDGRSDVERYGGDGTFVCFDPPSRRYTNSKSTQRITLLKSTVVRVLMAVEDVRERFFLRSLLALAKNLTAKKAKVEGGRACSEVLDVVIKGSDAKELTLKTLSEGQDVAGILIDSLMYDDDSLFSASLELLERSSSTLVTTLGALKSVILLDTEKLPIFKTVQALNADIGYLLFLIRSCEQWGTATRLSGPFDEVAHESFITICGKLLDFFYCAPEEVKQEKKVAVEKLS